MNFKDTAFSKVHRFSIGREEDSGQYYLSIPVANSLVDYEEYYLIDRQLHDGYPFNIAELSTFANQCRARLKDNLLFVKPGVDRGVG